MNIPDDMFPDMSDDDRKKLEEFRERIEKFGDEARKVGLYLENMAGMQHAHSEDEEPQTIVAATFIVGEQAFSDRVLNPEKHEEDKTFRTLTAGADPFDELRERMKKNIEEGKDPFDE